MARNNYNSTYYKVYRPKGVYGADVITVDMIDYRKLSSLAPAGAFWIAIGIFWLNLVSVIFPFFYSFGLIIYLIAKARDLMLYNRAKKYCALFASGKTRSIREICRYMEMSESAVRADLLPDRLSMSRTGAAIHSPQFSRRPRGMPRKLPKQSKKPRTRTKILCSARLGNT